MMFELTMAELKTAFRIFDEDGEGFIRDGFIIFSPTKIWTEFNLFTLPLPFFLDFKKRPKMFLSASCMDSVQTFAEENIT